MTQYGDRWPNLLKGTSGIDQIYGFEGQDTVIGFLGGDSLYGGSQNDSLYGGLGNDVLDGGSNPDLLDGGDGEDVVSYASAVTAVTLSLNTTVLSTGDAIGDQFVGIERFELSDHSDRFFGGDLGENAAGGFGNDTLDGGLGNDHLSGGDGNDSQNGGDGEDSLFGGSGRDLIQGGSGDDFLLGEDSKDFSFGSDTLFGGVGADTLNGSAGDDLMDGGSGADTFLDNPGADTFRGGTGWDVLIYDAIGMVNMRDPSQGTGASVGDVVSGIEVLLFRGIDGGSSFTYIGGSQAFTVSNLYAENYMNAYAGSGAERFVGLMAIHYTDMATGVTLTGQGSTLVGSRAATGDVIVNPNTIFLSEHGDIVTGLGGAFRNYDIEFYLHTMGGNDRISLANLRTIARIYTGSGDDTVNGIAGFGWELSLGTGNDVVLLRDAGDRNNDTGTHDILVRGDEGHDHLSVYASEGVALVGGIGNDTLVASDVVHTHTILDLDGGEGDDRIVATSRNIFSSVDLSGGTGNDRLEVRTVNGVVDGGGGNDVLDVTVYKNGYSWSINSHNGQVEVLGGAGDDVIVISTARIPAEYPDPSLEPRGIEIHGGNGNDHITGAYSDDGASGEAFVFQANWGHDTIAGGFDLGVDRLVFDSFSLTNLGSFDSVSGNAGWTLLEYRGQSVLIMGLSVLEVQADPTAILGFQ